MHSKCMWSGKKNRLPALIGPRGVLQYMCTTGDYALVGALGDDDDGSDSGSAYIFVRSGTSWSQQVKLTASDAGAPFRRLRPRRIEI